MCNVLIPGNTSKSRYVFSFVPYVYIYTYIIVIFCICLIEIPLQIHTVSLPLIAEWFQHLEQRPINWDSKKFRVHHIFHFNHLYLCLVNGFPVFPLCFSLGFPLVPLYASQRKGSETYCLGDHNTTTIADLFESMLGDWCVAIWWPLQSGLPKTSYR